MEVSIRMNQGDFSKIDLEKAMDGHYVQINSEVLIMSMHVTDGAIDKAFEAQELWDNLPDEIKDKYSEDKEL